MQCWLCPNTLEGALISGEHVILSAIGGRKEVSGFICRTCNSTKGAVWDSALAAELLWFSTAAGVRRGRGGEHPDLKVTTTTGETWRLRHDGHLVPDRPTLTVAQADDKTSVTIQARDRETAFNMLKRAAKLVPEIDPEVAIQDALNIRSYFTNGLALSLGFGGPKSGRSVVKSALALLPDAGVDKGDCLRALAYLLSEDPDADIPYRHYFVSDLVVDRQPNSLLHCVSVAGQPVERRIVAYVEFFDCVRYLVHVGDGYSGPAFQSNYALDPVAGEEVDIHVDFSRIEGQLEAAVSASTLPHGKVVEATSMAMEKVMARLQYRAFERAMLEAATSVGVSLDDEQPDAQQAKRLIEAFVANLRGYLEATARMSGVPIQP